MWRMHKRTAQGIESHDDIISRLKRAKGHMESVIRMMEEEKPCVEVARQLNAVTKAVGEAKRIFIQDHIEHCLDEDALDGKDMSLKDFKEMTRYL